MKKLILAAAIVAATAAPAMADGDPNYPPSEPPVVCIHDCTTAYTGFSGAGFPAAAGVALLGLGTATLVAIRRARR